MKTFLLIFLALFSFASPALASDGSSPKDSSRLVLIIVNKWYECDPVVSVLLDNKINRDLIKKPLPLPIEVNYPHFRRNLERTSPSIPYWPKPRLVYQINQTRVELWCVSDLLEHLPDSNTMYQSSSERKAEALATVFQGRNPSLVVAVGTAASYNKPASFDGSVVIGASTFIHNGHPAGGKDQNDYSKWQYQAFERLIPPTLSEAEFNTLLAGPTPTDWFVIPPMPVVALPLPISERVEPSMVADYRSVALGTANVSNGAEYATKDGESLEAFKSKNDPALIASIETTHGLIRAASNAPFIFISGIVNQVGKYATQVTPREYAQDLAAMHNAGIVIAWLLPRFAQ